MSSYFDLLVNGVAQALKPRLIARWKEGFRVAKTVETLPVFTISTGILLKGPELIKPQ